MKKDYLSEWFVDIQTRRSVLFSKAVTVVGILDEHRGPRWNFAKVKLCLKPADTITIVDCTSSSLQEFVDATFFGILDVLLTELSSPLRNLSIELLEIEDHPIDSNPIAFRLAGRDAARKALKEILFEEIPSQ